MSTNTSTAPLVQKRINLKEILITMLIIALPFMAAYSFLSDNSVTEKFTLRENLVILSTNIRIDKSSSGNFENFSNETAIKNSLVPSDLLKDGKIESSYGTKIELASSSEKIRDSFTISLLNLNENTCRFITTSAINLRFGQILGIKINSQEFLKPMTKDTRNLMNLACANLTNSVTLTLR